MQQPATLRPHLETQRGRILDGMAEAVAERGYAATAVADVIDVAHVSRRTFYQHFRNKEECFLAAYDLGVERTAAAVAKAFDTAAHEPWPLKLRRAFETLIAVVVAEPAFARVCLIEVLAVGPRGLDRRSDAVRRFVSFLDRAFELVPGRPLLPPALPEAIVGGVQSVITARLLSGRTDELPGLVDDLLFWGLLPLVPEGRARGMHTPVS